VILSGLFLNEPRIPTTAVGEILFGMRYTTTQGIMLLKRRVEKWHTVQTVEKRSRMESDIARNAGL
jgi:hypothetical protein